MVIEVLTWPDPRLLEVAQDVERVDDRVRALVADLIETMYAECGVGLAATQVGVPLRVVVIDCGPRGRAVEEGQEPPPSRLRALINARIVEREGTIVWREACLSLPGVSAEVERSARVVVEYLDPTGAAVRWEATDLEAVCVQHELDHLDGQLYVDRLGQLERRSTLLDYEAAQTGAREDAVGAAVASQ